jgi:putative alpha-1,2-mannosidase
LHRDYFPGRTFTIQTRKNSPQNVYIQSATLNGRALRQCWFNHTEMVKGGKLEIDLSPQPNKAWGIN